MSIAQIELMCADCAITIYPKDKKSKMTTKKANGKQSNHEFRELSTDEIEKSRKEWAEKYGNEKPTIDLKHLTASPL